MNKPLLIFDYDGTIHETMALYQSAVSDTVFWLKEQLGKAGLSEENADQLSEKEREILLERFRAEPEEARLKKWIGMNPPDMWKDFAPELPEPLKETAIRRVGALMDQKIEEKSRWYPGAEEMSETLKREGYQMLILSNSTERYAKTHWEHFQMHRRFLAFLACESYAHEPKEEIIRKLLSEPETVLKKAVCDDPPGAAELIRTITEVPGTNGKNAVVIGDRASDRKGAEANRLPFIGCLYGYGTGEELEGADAFAAAPSEIPCCIKSQTE